MLAHERSDLYQLLLHRYKYPGIPVAPVVDQIRSRTKARTKLPEWHEQDDIVFPPPLSMEQCSSEAAAKFKARLYEGKLALDLTGGTGVDSYYLSKRYEKLVFVEQDKTLAEIAQHNFSVLGANHIEVVNSTAEDFLSTNSEQFDLIYIDPARRKEGKKVFRWEDATPNLLDLQSTLVAKANKVLIKGAPLMDISLAIEQLDFVEEVIVVAVEHEVKELLFVLNRHFNAEIVVRASNMRGQRIDNFNFVLNNEQQEVIGYNEISDYLYEPNAAIMKSGGFNTVAKEFNLSKLHKHTHLYTSKKRLPDFPGRVFNVNSVVPFDKKLIQAACPTGKANIRTRNFPVSVASFRKKTGLQDGGDQYLFAVTDYQNKKRVIICEQIFST